MRIGGLNCSRSLQPRNLRSSSAAYGIRLFSLAVPGNVPAVSKIETPRPLLQTHLLSVLSSVW
jgi:hypothetical protein